MALVHKDKTVTEEEILLHLYNMLKARAFQLGLSENIVLKHYRGAKDVLKRIENIEYGDGYVKAVIRSTKATRVPPEHTIVVKDLTGWLRKVTVGVPLEESYHHVIVSEKIMKCDCPLALQMASKADYWVNELIKQHKIRLERPELLFVKHVLCKHTLAVMAKAVKHGAVRITDKLVDNLSLALISAGILENQYPNKQRIELVLKHLPLKQVRARKQKVFVQQNH